MSEWGGRPWTSKCPKCGDKMAVASGCSCTRAKMFRESDKRMAKQPKVTTMIICIEYDEKQLDLRQATELVDCVRDGCAGKLDKHGSIEINAGEIWGEEDIYKVTLVKSPIITEYYTVELIRSAE